MPATHAMTETTPAREHQLPIVPPDAVGHAADRAEDDAGGGQDQDEGQVVAAQRERPQVILQGGFGARSVRFPLF